MSMFNKFSSDGSIDIISSDISSNLSDTTTTRNSDNTKNVESDVKSRVDRTSTDPSSGDVNVNINAGVTTNDRNTIPIPSPNNNKDDKSPDTSDKIFGMNKTLFYVLLVILIILGIGVGCYMFYNKKKVSKLDNLSSLSEYSKSSSM